MPHRSTIQLLRFHFSFFLLPVYLFALAELQEIDLKNALLVFVVLHLLVYPSSNGYNSYMDRDDSPIGGLQNPLQPTKELYGVTVLMDVIALVISFFISPWFLLGILLYIIASRAYSYRGIRLKQYPVAGFIIVAACQGALIFFIAYHAMSPQLTLDVPNIPCLISSCLIGALYPLTQVYQHEADRKDGVTTISYLLGKKGSFFFSAFLFGVATLMLYKRFEEKESMDAFYLYLMIMFPVVLFFLYWMIRVWKDERAANFKNSLMMNVLATVCTSAFFITLFFMKH